MPSGIISTAMTPTEGASTPRNPGDLPLPRLPANTNTDVYTTNNGLNVDGSNPWATPNGTEEGAAFLAERARNSVWFERGADGKTIWHMPGATGAGTGAGTGSGSGSGSGSGAGGSLAGGFGGAELGDPTTWDVTQNQTVEGRINNLVNPNNPIIQQARARALEQMNERGLVNTSMGITAADSAAYEAAIPIAQADAATFAKAAGYNADQANQFAIKGAELKNQWGIAQLNSDTQKQIAQMDAESQAKAAALQQQHQKLLETNQQANSAYNTAMSAINNIQMNNNLDATTKTRMISQVWADLQRQMGMLQTTSGLDLSSNLNFSGYPGFDTDGRWVGFPDDEEAGDETASGGATASVEESGGEGPGGDGAGGGAGADGGATGGMSA